MSLGAGPLAAFPLGAEPVYDPFELPPCDVRGRGESAPLRRLVVVGTDSLRGSPAVASAFRGTIAAASVLRGRATPVSDTLRSTQPAAEVVRGKPEGTDALRAKVAEADQTRSTGDECC